MGSTRRQSQGYISTEGRVYPTLPVQTSPDQKTHSNKLLCRSSQEQLPVRGIASAVRQKGCRSGSKSSVPGVLQPVIPGPQTQQPVATRLGPEQTKQLFENTIFQNGNTGNNTNLPPDRGVGDFHRFQRRILPHPYKQPVQEVYAFSHSRHNLPIQSSTLWPVHSPHGIHGGSQRGEMACNERGYKDPPVPRRLVGQGHLPPGLSSTDKKSGIPLQEIGVAGKRGQIRTGTQTDFQLRRLPVRLEGRQGQTHHRTLADPTKQSTGDLVTTSLSGPETNVPDRSINCHRETSTFGQTAHETHTVASQEQLEGTRIPGKDNPHSKVTPPTPEMVAGGRQCCYRSTLTPTRTCSANLYRRIKRRVGRTLKRPYGKGKLVTPGKQVAHKLSRVKGSSSGSTRVPSSLYEQGSSHSYRQYHCGSLHKQRRGNEVRPPVCLTLEDSHLVHKKSGDPQSSTYSRPSQCDSRQIIQTGSDHSNRMVPQSGDFSSNMLKVAHPSSGPICHTIQQQAPSVCLTGSRPPGLDSGCSQPVLGGAGPVRLPTSGHLGQSGGEVTGLPLQQNNSDCSRVAQHALVLGPGGNVQPDSTMSSQHTKPSVPTIQPGPSQEPVGSESACLAPRASAIKQQGFSEAVAARIEAPQRRSTRSLYEAKWTIFTKWCLSNQVDFKAPPLKAVADFLLHLFQDRQLQPGTIDGYRSAIADKLGNATINVSKDENLTRLLDSFHRDRPKGRRGIPSWNLSLVLHQLTKAPFEPLKEASLKHLTFKTVFLMALGSGKRRSEIHAWLHKNIRHQSDWSKVSFYPSPSFLSKNQLAKEGPDSVAPVVIPALAHTIDKSLKGDRSLCPVRALRYYLDRTSDLRQNKELVFISFKKGFDKDISSATVSSWIKQTVILCYELSDQQALTLHQVKAHDVRAFAASKAFQAGISLEQILSACHWKSHNTFTQFYLKDVAWADSELFHLGPVVAAQQIHHQAR